MEMIDDERDYLKNDNRTNLANFLFVLKRKDWKENEYEIRMDKIGAMWVALWTTFPVEERAG